MSDVVFRGPTIRPIRPRLVQQQDTRSTSLVLTSVVSNNPFVPAVFYQPRWKFAQQPQSVDNWLPRTVIVVGDPFAGSAINSPAFRVRDLFRHDFGMSSLALRSVVANIPFFQDDWPNSMVIRYKSHQDDYLNNRWLAGLLVEAASVSTAKGGYGPPVIVRPIKRHKKLDTFREELETLILGVRKVAEPPQEIPEITEAIQQTDAIAERFNIVQTLDDQGVIASQMELLRQDFEATSNLMQAILANIKKPKPILIDPEEEFLLILATEV